jgi:hypothetical protein
MKMLTTAAALAAVLVSAGTAMAAPAQPGNPSTVPPANAHRGQYASNANLRTARRHVERAIDRLQHDAEDYGGHREKAIDDLGVARQFLDQALDYQRSRGVSGRPVQGPGAALPIGNPGASLPNQPIDTPDTTNVNQNGSGNGFERGQGASNQNLREERRQVEAAIDALNRDASDYGGFKARAIDKLQAARSELEAALNFVHRPGVQNGGSGGRVSDANLQYVSEHVQTAISRLEQDRHDYAGHRVAAINDLQQANGFINSALSYDASHKNGSTGSSVLPGTQMPGTGATLPIGNPRPGPIVGKPVNQPGGVGGKIGQGASNESILDARRNLESALDALNRDAHDYGGYRVKAIDALQAARSELFQALNVRKNP